jgi:hypothetical protein
VALHNRVYHERLGEGDSISKNPGEFYEERFDEAEFRKLEKILDSLLAQPGKPRVSCFPTLNRRDWWAGASETRNTQKKNWSPN